MASLGVVANDAEPPATRVDADDALIRLARARDLTAMKTLYERHATSVLRLLRDLCGNGEEAADLTQETFRRAFEHLAELDDPQRFKAWVLGIARRVRHETRRRTWRERLRAVFEDDQGPLEVPDLATPEVLFLRREAEAVMRQALEHLTDDQRCAILFPIDHGLAYQEIADQLGWSMAKVKVEIHRARCRLRQEIAKAAR